MWTRGDGWAGGPTSTSHDRGGGGTVHTKTPRALAGSYRVDPLDAHSAIRGIEDHRINHT
eukprot:1185537-Prorocentrum_minimum.AAC.5